MYVFILQPTVIACKVFMLQESRMELLWVSSYIQYYDLWLKTLHMWCI